MVGPEVAPYARGRHSRGNGNPEGRDEGVISSSWSFCLPLWISPDQVRGRLNQVRNDKLKRLQYPVRLWRVSSFRKIRALDVSHCLKDIVANPPVPLVKVVQKITHLFSLRVFRREGQGFSTVGSARKSAKG